MTSKAALARTERDEAIANLRAWIKPGDTIYTVLRHVSASGMSRSISLVVPIDRDDGYYNGRPQISDVSYWAARALGDKIDQTKGGVKIGGCGMDMGFHLVYSLSCSLFADGFVCIGERCPSNDHNNPIDWNATPRVYPERDGAMMHSDPGYALRQTWL